MMGIIIKNYNILKKLKYNWPLIFTIAICSVVFWVPQNPMRWRQQELYAMLAASLIISYMAYQRFSAILGLNVLFLLVNGFIYFKNPHFYFGIFADLAQVMFPSIIAQALLWCMASLFISFFLVQNSSRLKTLLRSCEYLFWLDIAVMIGRRLFDKEFHRYLGALDNESLDACFLLILYTLSLIRLKRPAWQHIFFGIFIYLCDSTTAILGLALVWGVWFFLTYKIKTSYKVLISVAAVLGITGICSFLIGQHHFWNSEGRYHIWQVAMTYWWKGGNHLLGLGPGSFEIYGPGLGLQGREPGGIQTIFIWLHSDYLQVLFQSGIIGLILFLALHVEVLYKSYKSKLVWLFLAAMVFAFVEITQMNTEHAPLSLMGVLILVLVLGKNESVTG